MTNEITRAYDLADYVSSTDYAKLAKLSRTQSIICLVDCLIDEHTTLREVGRTGFTAKGEQELWTIATSGRSFLTAFSEAAFISRCARLNVEFIEPLAP